MFRHPRLLFAALTCSLVVTTAPAAAQSRGELLYFTNCQACHSEQVHWRDNRLATDWSSLVGQVRRWQNVGRLGWPDDDIKEVARYLNEAIYNFSEKDDALTSVPGTQSASHAAGTPMPSPAAGYRLSRINQLD